MSTQKFDTNVERSDAEKKAESVVSDFMMPNKGTVKKVTDRIHLVAGQGNSVLVETERGLVITDTGPGGAATREMIDMVRGLSDKPVMAIVYSHGHIGYNHGAHLWLEDADRRGDPRPEVIGHARLPVRYSRYKETWKLQNHLNGMQFGSSFPEQPPEQWFTYPTVTFDERYVIDGGDCQVEVLSAPSETDDAVALWIPGERVLYAGPAFIKALPNVGTPLRTLRDPVRWADTLERLMALEPEILIAEFGRPLVGREKAREALKITIDALRYLRAETVARMNQGMTEREIIHDISYPEEIFGHWYLKPSYGMPEYIVRDIWRSENGWWNRNATDLHPAEPARAARAVREAIADPQHVIDCAAKHRKAGEAQLALHILDILALDEDGDEFCKRAEAMKAEILAGLAEETSSFVSAQLYRSEAKRLKTKSQG